MDKPFSRPRGIHSLTLRGHVAYLRLYLQWREKHSYALAASEPEPRKVTAALEAVTAYVLKEFNAKAGRGK
jgi:hypothetical protein